MSQISDPLITTSTNSGFEIIKFMCTIELWFAPYELSFVAVHIVKVSFY